MNYQYQLVLESLNDRSHLPFRRVAEIFIIDGKGNVVCKMFDTYVKFPGGGVDDGEKPIDAVKREIMEEVGAIVKDIKEAAHLQYIWPIEWAQTDKQKARYQQFKGEDNTIFIGKLVKLVKPTSQEKDRWYGKLLYPITDAINMIHKNAKHELKGFEKYRATQLKILESLKFK